MVAGWYMNVDLIQWLQTETLKTLRILARRPAVDITLNVIHNKSMYISKIMGYWIISNPFHSWLNFDTPLVCCQISRAPSIQLKIWFLYTPSIHEIVLKKSPLLASHTRSVQNLRAEFVHFQHLAPIFLFYPTFWTSENVWSCLKYLTG